MSQRNAAGWAVLGVVVAVLLWIGMMAWDPQPAHARRQPLPRPLTRENVCRALEDTCAGKVLKEKNPYSAEWAEVCADWLKECEPCGTT